MTDDIQRQALARSIAIRLQLLTHADLRVVDDVVTRLCQRATDRRRHVTEAIDDLIAGVEARLAELDLQRAELHEAARAEMVGGPPAHPTTLGDVWIGNTRPTPEALEDIRRMNESRDIGEVRIGIPGDNTSLRPMTFEPASEFAIDAHLTRVSGTPATLALADVAPDRDEDLEVELEWGVDEHAGSGT